MSNQIHILFVCTGNICRSPAAEAAFARFAEEAGIRDRVVIDSAAIENFHEGEPPDPRAIKAGAKRGLDLSQLRARQVDGWDFDDFDFILAMDKGHKLKLEQMKPMNAPAEIKMMRDYDSRHTGDDIADPFYGGPEGFELMLDHIEDSARGMVQAIQFFQLKPREGHASHGAQA
ncbi:MAG: low molecular weight protein-tyrosine-phosphatase [Alphaproteobacteria bacterium]